MAEWHSFSAMYDSLLGPSAGKAHALAVGNATGICFPQDARIDGGYWMLVVKSFGSYSGYKV